MKYQLNLDLIRKELVNRKITTQEMADLLGIKNRSGYSKRESGKTSFRSTKVPVLSEIFGIPIKKFFIKSLRKSQ